jgi:hypothetical protein
MPEFSTVTDVMSAACRLQDALAFGGETAAAEELERALHASWATSSLSLEHIARALDDVRPVVRRTLDADALALLDGCARGARALVDPPERRSLVQTIAGWLRR